MAFDVTQFGLSPRPGETNWGTLLAVPSPVVPKKKKPYGFDGSKAPKGSTTTTSNTNSSSSSSTSSGGGGSTTPTKLTAAEKKAARAKRIAARKAANAAARAERNNPLLAPYKSPAQLRAEAAELAALSVASEESLRTQQGLQETGLTGLTTALSNRLSGVSNDYAGMLRGLQGSYNTVAGDATSAGETALAAAGAPTSTPVAGANPLMASNFAALGAVPATYAGAAELTGAQLVGGSKAKLQDALIARSNTVSANTAKYLQQLQDTEYSKAIAKVTADQNAARLGIDAEYKAGQLGVAQTNAQTRIDANAIKRENNKIKLQIANAGGTGKKAIRAAQRGLLGSAGSYVQGVTSASGDNTYTVTIKSQLLPYDIKTVPIVATSPEAAREKANKLYKGNPNIDGGGYTVSDVILDRANSSTVVPTQEQVIQRTIGFLTMAGMNPNVARQWIIDNIIIPYGVL